MKLSNIIAEAGGSPKNFPLASEIPVTLYDEDDCVDTSESIHYVEPLFAKNRRAQSNFFQYLTILEQKPVEAINIRIDANSVILHYKSSTTRPIYFSRQKPLDPMDFT